MPVHVRHRRKSISSQNLELIHRLNQQYKQEWDRAQRLQAELDHIKKSKAWRLLSWCRRLAFWRRSPLPTKPICHFPVENLDECRIPPTGAVSIVIPFSDQLDLLRNCLRSLRRSTYPPHEIILLDNGSTDSRTLRFLDRMQHRQEYRVLSCPGPFNFSRLCNAGASRATGDFLLFLNNDVQVLARNWLRNLLELAGHPRIGVVGATLLYPDKTLQHAGIFPRDDGEWTHAYRGLPHDHAGEMGELKHARSVPAVTGACMMIRRELFLEMDGFDEQYPVTFNDVDLCCRVRQRGLTVAITPRARLWHFESLSRGYSRSESYATAPTAISSSAASPAHR